MDARRRNRKRRLYARGAPLEATECLVVRARLIRHWPLGDPSRSPVEAGSQHGGHALGISHRLRREFRVSFTYKLLAFSTTYECAELSFGRRRMQLHTRFRESRH